MAHPRVCPWWMGYLLLSPIRKWRQDRIDACTVSPSSMELSGLDAAVDFVVAFAVVHEMPSGASFFLEAARAMKSGAGLLLAEPAGHVSEEKFQEEITAARAHGIRVIDRPSGLELSPCLYR
jgi:hypothetical protein